MDGGDGGGWVSVSLFGLLAMSDEIFEVLYCRHGGGLICERYGGLVMPLLRKGPLLPRHGFYRGATSKQAANVGC